MPELTSSRGGRENHVAPLSNAPSWLLQRPVRGEAGQRRCHVDGWVVSQASAVEVIQTSHPGGCAIARSLVTRGEGRLRDGFRASIDGMEVADGGGGWRGGG